MSPEYAEGGLYSTKSDIFSFGVMVLEIVSGKKNAKFSYVESDTNFLTYVSFLILYNSGYMRY